MSPIQMPNGSFEWGWSDIIVHGQPMQQPRQWKLSALDVGEALRSTGAFPLVDDDPVHEVVKCIPDVVHVDCSMVPPDEHLGGDNALILHGEWTLKVFRSSGPFSLRMETDVYTIDLNSICPVLPINVHQHGDGSPGAAAIRVGVDGVYGRWHTSVSYTHLTLPTTPYV